MVWLCPKCGSTVDARDTVCPCCGVPITPEQAPEDDGRRIRQGWIQLNEAPEPEVAPPVSHPAEDDGYEPRMEGGELYGSFPGDAVERTYVDPAVTEERISFDAEPRVYGVDGEPMSPETMPRPGRNFSETREDPLRMPPRLRKQKYVMSRRMVNWARVLLLSVLAVIVLMVGAVVFLLRTSSGQRIMARMGFDATSTALWEVGAERVDVGDIDGGIAYFERAAEKDGEEDVNVSGLLELGAAYESAGRIEDAEALYTTIFTDIVPSATESYTNVIRIMLAQSRNAEAAELMQKAWEMTGSTTFYTQRTNLLPTAPVASMPGGYYEEDITVSLTVGTDCEVYYTFDDEVVLPEGGTLYTGALKLDERTWHLRAVSVRDELMSDELNVTYTVSMPSPSTPYANLAPNTYPSRRQVQLWVSIEQHTDENITIYYTIDGSNPTADSPIYDGTPIWLPAGQVTLRAVSVNQYGKASNMLERTYKFNVKPVPLTGYSTTGDVVNGITLGVTTESSFVSTHGGPSSTEPFTERSDMGGEFVKANYDWGYAVFNRNAGTNVLVELYFTSSHFKAPRSTGIGDSLDKVVGKFRDMGQLESPSGNRGLYELNAGGKGYIYVQEDGGHLIRYTALTPDYHTWQLDYICDESDTVVAVDMIYWP